MPDSVTVWELLAGGSGESPAIAAPGRESLDFAGLHRHVESTVRALNGFGIGRNDRMAIVLPNGPEMASAFVSVACAATAAPLNPAYRQPEYAFYLSDLSAKALILEAGSDSPARVAAADLGIPVLELHADSEAPAGTFELVPEGAGESESAGGNSAGDGLRGGLAEAGDIALILHTSGTTSRPKIVPLSHRNVCASAANIQRTLELSAADRCLNVMPLFHIHGLMAAVLAPLGVGGSIFCSPGFNVLRFYSWLDEARPTYYTAVPTMHQAILARAPRNRDAIERAALRFIRSASASLPPQVMAELEETFGAPVVEAYAMTEAAHQMTCNPLPPAARKPGTVGIAAGPEVSVMDEAGAHLPRGRGGRDRHPRRQRQRRVREQPHGERRGLHQRVVTDGRPGQDGRRGLRHDYRPPEGDHQPRRGEDLAARDRRSDPLTTPPCARWWRSRCPIPSWARRWWRLRCSAREWRPRRARSRPSRRSVSPTSRFRGRSSSWTTFPRDRPASSSAFGMAEKLGLA